MPYLAGLDGLRAIAVLLVVAFHAKAPFAGGGYLGVDVFFVLSGFLITTILHVEYQRTYHIRYGAFLGRRILRLMPVLLIFLSLYLLVAPFAWPDYPHHVRDAVIAAAYISDFAYSIAKIPHVIRHTWSLSVEMHFYLLWPLALMAIFKLKPRHMILILAGLYFISTAWRIQSANLEPWHQVYYAFETRISGLILGSLVTIYLRFNNPTIPKILTALMLVAMAAIMTLTSWNSLLTLQLGVLLAELSSACIIISVFNKSAITAWLSSSPLAYIGKISYGIYLFHYPIIFYLRPDHPWVISLAIGAGTSFLMAAISYHAVEAKFMKMRKRFRQSSREDQRSLA